MSYPWTPFNPDPKAVARVLEPLPVPDSCPCCGSKHVRVAHHDEIYGKAYGNWPWLYLCVKCRAYVGMHPFTGIPLGFLADQETRDARKECKPAFEQLWQSGKLTRSQAYNELADALGLERGKAHFGWFDVDQCRKALSWAQSRLVNSEDILS